MLKAALAKAENLTEEQKTALEKEHKAAAEQQRILDEVRGALADAQKASGAHAIVGNGRPIAIGPGSMRVELMNQLETLVEQEDGAVVEAMVNISSMR